MGENMRWSIGAFLMGCGTPAFFFGAVEWFTWPNIAFLVETILGLSAMAAGTLLIYVSEKRNK
jgi:hypothetical protein